MRTLFWYFSLLIVGFTVLFLPNSALGATCAISSDTVITQAYVDAGSCDAITISGAVSTTWIGTVDLVGAGTVTVQSGATMVMGTSSAMVLGSTDDVVIDGIVTHATGSTYGVQITARNLTINGTGSINTNQKGCPAGRVNGGSAPGYGPNVSTGVCGASLTGSGQNGAGGASHSGGGGRSHFLDNPQTTGYGTSTSAELLGSGGGGGSNGSSANGDNGGDGGGRVRLVISGTLTVNGTILANGGAGNVGYSGGGGSGGSIYISAGTLTGSASIAANGGNASGYGGGGGGGRVVVYYGSLSGFELAQISASGGAKGAGYASNADGGNGSTFLLDRSSDDGAGTLTITSGLDFEAGTDYRRDQILVLGSGARLGCSSLLTVLSIEATTVRLPGTTWTCSASPSSISVSSTNKLYLSGSTFTFSGSIPSVVFLGGAGISATSSNFTLSNTDSLIFSATSSFTIATSTISLTKAGSSLTWQTPSELTLSAVTATVASVGTTSAAGGSLNLIPNISLTLENYSYIGANVSSTFSALTVRQGSTISASEKGCQAGVVGSGSGYGPNLTTGVCAVSTSGYGRESSGGAAYGGAGGRPNFNDAPQTTTYGSSADPQFHGSGGAAGANGNSVQGDNGGAGGGLLRFVVAGTATIDGSVTANGGVGSVGYSGGGGSGGTVYISASTFAGSGSIAANGGNGSGYGGGGGGGRLAFRYSSVTFNGTSSTSGGAKGVGYASNADGSAGSIYTLVVNQSPDVPASLGQAGLVNGATTGTNTPVFAFTLSDPDVSNTVSYRIQIDDSSGFGSPVVDYTSSLASQGARTFQVGQAEGSGTYAVGSVGQSLSDGSYYWRVKAIDNSGSESSYTTANSGAVAFVVDTASRSIQFAQATASGLESLTATSVRIVLDTAHFEDVSVAYALSGTASDGGLDYTLAAGTATISAGDTSTTISIVIVDDSIDEPNETLVLTLSTPTHASLGANTSLTYTITDNDVAGITVSPTSLSLSEGGTSSGYTIVLDSQPTSTVQVVLTVPADLTASTSTLTFTSSNWSSSQTVTLTATDDSTVEGTHTGTVTHALSFPGGAFVYGFASLSSISSVAVTITDNDTTSNSSATVVTDSGGGAATAGSSSPGAVPSLFSYSSSPLLPTSQSAFLVIEVPASSSPVSPPPSSVDSPSLPATDDIVPKLVTISILNPRDPQRVAEVLNSGRRDLAQEVQAATTLRRDAQALKIELSLEDREALSVFVTYGLSDVTRALGMGERRALVRDAMETLGPNFLVTDLERMARGIIPVSRNISKERAQLSRVRQTFRSIFGHDPRFTDLDENLAWNTLMYRIRFSRDLAAERKGIQSFRRIFGRSPQDPFQWATVRVLGYIR